VRTGRQRSLERPRYGSTGNLTAVLLDADCVSIMQIKLIHTGPAVAFFMLGDRQLATLLVCRVYTTKHYSRYRHDDIKDVLI
jgi:hypothetical protein